MPAEDRQRPMTPSYPFREDRVVLRDGRRLSYAEFGVDRGPVVFWFHGSPGSRTQVPPGLSEAAVLLGLRVIGVDRPGMGGSSRHHRMTLLSWADDIRQFANLIGVDRFSVVGMSGGGAFGLACAYALPDRVAALVTLGSPAPLVGKNPAPGYSRRTVALAQSLFRIRRPLGWMSTLAVMPFRPFVHPALWVVQRVWWRVDRPVFQDPAFARMFAESILVATERGIHGIAYDYALFGQPWGFPVGAIEVPVSVWHGDEDPFVPFAHALYLAEQIEGAQLVVLHGGGHLAGMVRIKEVLETAAKLATGGTSLRTPQPPDPSTKPHLPR